MDLQLMQPVICDLLATLNQLSHSQQQQLLRDTTTLQAEQSSVLTAVTAPLPCPLLASHS